ncbi:MAG: ankyrin repeat domain-containing protein [Sphingomonas sp.]|uniref:ankyrin repeat domain-containing protein n=1 Tax=Sphingomonas sp. TaxID=28214 RepID=UPI003F7DA667
MPRILTPKTSLDNLRKDAKRWLKALRAGDEAAIARLRESGAKASADPGLRDVQHALALEYGCENWIALKAALDDVALDRQSYAERLDQLLGHGWEGSIATARRILNRYPSVAHDSLFTAAACGDIAEVERRLARDPDAAKAAGGPKEWTALAHVAYGRLDAVNGVTIARLLLAAGADPQFSFNDGWDNSFTLVTGAIGLGEGAKPSHPQATEVVELLVAAGASPFDTQALYNISIVGSDLYWYDLLWRLCDAQGITDHWHDAVSYRIGGTRPLNPLDYLLGNAVGQNHLARADWLLAHGANPDTPHAYTGQAVHALAQLSGFVEMAALLERHGAAPVPLSGEEAFRAACLSGDEARARALLTSDPSLVANPAPLLAAAEFGNAPAIALLLALGADARGLDHEGISPLHRAVQSDSVESANLLIAAGAEIDLRERKWNGTPLSWAGVLGRPHMVELLAPLSSDIWPLVHLGLVDRLEAVLAADPSLANRPRAGDDAPTPLFHLSDDDDKAVAAACVLLRHGADPRAIGKNGQTAIDAARRRDLDEAADLMEAWRHDG